MDTTEAKDTSLGQEFHRRHTNGSWRDVSYLVKCFTVDFFQMLQNTKFRIAMTLPYLSIHYPEVLVHPAPLEREDNMWSDNEHRQSII